MRDHTFEGQPCRHGHGTTRYLKGRRCVTCRRDRANARYVADPDAGRDRAKAWRTANPERKRQNDAAWREANWEYKKQIDAAWRANNWQHVPHLKRRWQIENRDRHNASNRKSAKRRPDSIRANVIRYRARKRGAIGYFTTVQAWRILAWQDECCSYCDATVDLHIDPIIPLSRGGSNWPWNLQWLCAHHNKSKAAKTDAEYRLISDLPSDEPISVTKWRRLFIFLELPFPEPF